MLLTVIIPFTILRLISGAPVDKPNTCQVRITHGERTLLDGTLTPDQIMDLNANNQKENRNPTQKDGSLIYSWDKNQLDQTEEKELMAAPFKATMQDEQGDATRTYSCQVTPFKISNDIIEFTFTKDDDPWLIGHLTDFAEMRCFEESLGPVSSHHRNTRFDRTML
ncbi:uncharacterized protein IL334_001142 [Kwoniella shivajii]|uniref:Uncharacterized protein n=1 Tax=Kwoniella shivajii TaxID=564305 RepID=A0ABZ1CRQ4_9TREE|nr:hypothetical protein IL334_001142 [Kwoniella shivajii]